MTTVKANISIKRSWVENWTTCSSERNRRAAGFNDFHRGRPGQESESGGAEEEARFVPDKRKEKWSRPQLEVRACAAYRDILGPSGPP